MTTLNIEPYLFKTYDRREYNCWHLVLDCLNEFNGLTVPDFTPENVTRGSLAAQFTKERIDMFEKVPNGSKSSGCIAFMTHPVLIPHVGFLYNNKILSMKKSGPTYENIMNASRGYKKLEYYKCKP